MPVGAPLPNLAMLGLLGDSAKLGDFHGTPLIINVWASWCAPCRQEMASIDRLRDHYASDKLRVIGISTDDYAADAESYLRKAKLGFRHFIDSKLVLERMLGADRIPLTVLVDREGKVVARHYGARVWDSPQNLRMIERALAIK